jgi:hypothetical protein
VLGVSVMKSKHVASIGFAGPLAIGGVVFTVVFLSSIGY